MDGRLDQFVSFVQRYAVFAGGLLGAILLAAGVYVDPTSKGGAVLVGLGGSIVAAFVLALMSLARDDLLDALFRQGVVEAFPSRIARCKDEYWRTLLDGVRREYRVMGVANHGYIGAVAKEDRYKQLFRAAVERGVTIEFIWLSPTTPLATTREGEEGRATRADTVKSILFFWSLREQVGEEARKRFVLKEHHHIPSCGLTIADDSLTVTHYVVGQDNLDSPGWILTATAYPFYRRALAFLRRKGQRPDLVEVYLNTYREVQAKAAELTAERVADLEARLSAEYDVGKPSETDKRKEKFPDENLDV
jgi:hypothetical protein